MRLGGSKLRFGEREPLRLEGRGSWVCNRCARKLRDFVADSSDTVAPNACGPGWVWGL